jgi:hypothetical protein
VVVRLRDDRGQRFGVVGRDDEEIDAAVEQLPHVLDLAAAGISGVREHHAQVLVARGLALDLLAHVDAPGLGEVRERDADHVLV